MTGFRLPCDASVWVRVVVEIKRPRLMGPEAGSREPEAEIKTGSRSSPSEATEALFHLSRNLVGVKELSLRPEDFLR